MVGDKEMVFQYPQNQPLSCLIPYMVIHSEGGQPQKHGKQFTYPVIYTGEMAKC
jgi:hypothetical protein